MTHINIHLESLWPMAEHGQATATCSCGWTWEEVFHGNPADKANPSAISSSDQMKAAVEEHRQWHMREPE